MEDGPEIDLNELPKSDEVQEVAEEQQNDNASTNVDESVVEPAVGMSFDSGEEFAKFCHEYAFRKGFTFFSRSTTLMKEYKEKGIKRTAAGSNEPMYYMMERIRLNCKYGGRKKSQGSNVTGCKVYVDARIENTKMVITKCSTVHNHPLAPKYSRIMVNFRSVDDVAAQRIAVNDVAGISIIKSYNSLVVDSGCHENVTFNKQDVRNVVKCQRREARIQGDALALENYFQEQMDYNNDFFCAVQRDEEGKLMNAFWSDPRSRAMFKEFGDIVTFDTTFLCNRYRMPFAPFVGVSHHGKSIVFAAALLSHEDAETFVWVFNQWLKCMGKPPQGILTDQCRAIGKAIEIVFPEVPHRLCLWHILQNAARNLGKLTNWKEIDEALQLVVHDSLDPIEFDEAWAEMIAKFELENNSWLKEAFEIRQKWAPGHWRNSFWAGMSSTQRSEGINRFFKSYVSLETGLIQFIKQYERALKEKVEEENYLNYSSKHRPLPFDKDALVEYVYHKAYTNAKFEEVKVECAALKYVNLLKLTTLGGVQLYSVEEKITKPIWKARKKTFSVTIDKGKGEFVCSCKLFEFRGILCRHVISVIEREDIDSIPEKYVMDRWRKDMVRDYEKLKVSYHDPADLERVEKHKELTRRHNYLSSLALHNEETLAIYKEHTDKIRSTLEETIGIVRHGSQNTSWWDPTVQKVYGRCRVRPREENQRHLKKKAVAADEAAIKDPVDKRHTGRALKNRKPNPCEKSKVKKKRKRKDDAAEHEEAAEADNELHFGLNTQDSDAVNLNEDGGINLSNNFDVGEPNLHL